MIAVSVRRRRQRGATMLEAALGFTLFMTVVFGIMEFARLVWIYSTVSYLAREATRYASVHGAESKTPLPSGEVEAEAAVKAQILPQAIGLDPARLTLDMTRTPDANPGSTVRITLSYAFNPVTPFIPSPPVASTSQLVISQ